MTGAETLQVVHEMTSQTNMMKRELSLPPNVSSSGLIMPHRSPFTEGYPELALPTRSVPEPQHCSQSPTRWNRRMVHSGQHIREVVHNRIIVMDSRKAYVYFSFRSIAFFNASRPYCSGIWKDYSLVRITSSPWIFNVLTFPTSSTVIQQIKMKCDRGLALMGYYYFDFKDIAKQGVRGLLASLLSQFCASSNPCYQILSELYLENLEGSRQPDNQALIEALKKILRLPDAPMRCVIMDAIDECPITSGFPTAREEVLDLLKELVGLRLPNLRICVTSRPEIDIRTVLKPLTSLDMSLHDQSGQRQDILDYIENIVHSDPRMGKLRPEDQQMVIDTLSAKADGMCVITTAMFWHSRLLNMQVSMGVLPNRNSASLLTKRCWACSE